MPGYWQAEIVLAFQCEVVVEDILYFSEESGGELFVEYMKWGNETIFFWSQQLVHKLLNDEVGDVMQQDKMNLTSLFANQKDNNNFLYFFLSFQSIDDLNKLIFIFLYQW